MPEGASKLVEAAQQPDTKRKHKFLFEDLGISGSVYLDKLLKEQPKELVVKLNWTK